jgi:DNA polymerase-3 subunit epsilon
VFAIIDVETTGGNAHFEKITEIAIVLHDGDRVMDTFSTLINPERSIPWSITQLTGITDEMVAQAPKFYEIAKKIVEMTENAIFVAHNVSFDYAFVKEEFNRLGYDFNRKKLCTVQMSRKTFPGLPSYSLSNLKKHFGIHANRSHRALDDTLATVEIFERILAGQSGSKNIKQVIDYGLREAKLPPGISLEQLRALPELCGVYYFHDSKGTVIYVGKSLNIRKRIVEHFADKTPKGEKLRTGVAHISCDVTGSELAALLFESAEIKRIQPPVNRAQRNTKHLGCIFRYTDQNGYTCLAAGKITAKNAQKLDIVADFPKIEHARNQLLSMVKQHELCYRLSHLDNSDRACFHYSIRQCKGACIGAESPLEYNGRAEQAIQQVNKRLIGSFLLVDKGRTATEKTIFGVRNGRFIGFGFFDSEENHFTAETLFDNFSFYNKDDPDAGKIIQGFLEKKHGLKVIKIDPNSQ